MPRTLEPNGGAVEDRSLQISTALMCLLRTDLVESRLAIAPQDPERSSSSAAAMLAARRRG